MKELCLYFLRFCSDLRSITHGEARRAWGAGSVLPFRSVRMRFEPSSFEFRRGRPERISHSKKKTHPWRTALPNKKENFERIRETAREMCENEERDAGERKSSERERKQQKVNK